MGLKSAHPCRVTVVVDAVAAAVLQQHVQDSQAGHVSTVNAALNGLPRELENLSQHEPQQSESCSMQDTVMKKDSDEDQSCDNSEQHASSSHNSAAANSSDTSWAGMVKGKVKGTCHAVGRLLPGGGEKKQKGVDGPITATCKAHARLLLAHKRDAVQDFIGTELGAACVKAAAIRLQGSLQGKETTFTASRKGLWIRLDFCHWHFLNASKLCACTSLLLQLVTTVLRHSLNRCVQLTYIQFAYKAGDYL